MLTDERLAEIERLEREATPGPWEAEGHGGVHMDGTRDWYALRRPGVPHLVPPRLSRSDVGLIVALRNAAPDLIAAAKRMRELEAVLETVDRLADAAQLLYVERLRGRGVLFPGNATPEEQDLDAAIMVYREARGRVGDGA